VTITDILRTLARFRRLAIFVAIITLAVGSVAAFAPPDRFHAASTVLVQPRLVNEQAVSVQLVDFLVPTFIRTMDTRDFRRDASRDVPASVRDAHIDIDATATLGTGIITIEVSSTERDAVAPWAQAMAGHLVDSIDNDFVALDEIDTAVTPSGPYAPRRGLILAITALLALVDALVAATIASAVRGGGDRVSELRDRFGAAVLGEIPRIRSSLAELGPAELMTHPGAAKVAESLQTLRANVTIALEERPHPWVVVTSSVPGEGKSLISTSLAWLIASVNRPTILVDGDSRRPAAHRRLRLSIGQGLESIGPHDLRAHLQATDSQWLRFLGAGRPDRHPAEIASTHLPNLLQQASMGGDVVIIDSPPLPVAAETIVFASACESVLLVIDARRRDLSNVERVITALQDRDVHILGVVINRSRRKVQSGYYAQTAKVRSNREAASPRVADGSAQVSPVSEPERAGATGTGTVLRWTEGPESGVTPPPPGGGGEPTSSS
jgi:capsular exopolysaccharide synthesis family protein